MVVTEVYMTIVLKGVPSNIGALNIGTESAPKLLREANLVSKLSLYHDVVDLGDVKLPNDLIRHNVSPVRNWPSPKIVWEATINQLSSCFAESDFTIIMGGGCSIFTGVFSKFHQIYGDQSKIISIDHHIDIKEPNSEICMGATAYTHWFLTSTNQWFGKPVGFTKEGIIALGYSEDTIKEGYDISSITSYSKEAISSIGVNDVVKKSLINLNSDDKVIVHLDLDVINEDDLESVYMPSPNGMAISTVRELLKGIVSDSRVLGLVITEFSGASESSETDAKKVVELIGSLFEQ